MLDLSHSFPGRNSDKYTAQNFNNSRLTGRQDVVKIREHQHSKA